MMMYQEKTLDLLQVLNLVFFFILTYFVMHFSCLFNIFINISANSHNTVHVQPNRGKSYTVILLLLLKLLVTINFYHYITITKRK